MKKYQMLLMALVHAILVLLIFGTAFTGIAQANNTSVIHYWDMDTLNTEGIPKDVVADLPMSKVGTPIYENAAYGEAYTGAGNYLKTVWSVQNYLKADVYNESTFKDTAMDFGTDSFSFSFWSYDDLEGEKGITAAFPDGDGRGPRVFDNLKSTTTGIQLGSNISGIFNYRTDDASGNSVLSNTTLSTISVTQDAWTHVVVNVNRTAGLAEVLFNAASQGTYDVSMLTGVVKPTQDLEIGVINAGGGTGNGAQNSGLDDLAFYNGLLSQDQIAGLAAGTLVPTDIVPFYGDINEDGSVNDIDLNLLQSSFEAAGTGGGSPTWNQNDLDLLLDNFGMTGLQSQSVPEPSSLALLGLAALAALVFRKRN